MHLQGCWIWKTLNLLYYAAECFFALDKLPECAGALDAAFGLTENQSRYESLRTKIKKMKKRFTQNNPKQKEIEMENKEFDFLPTIALPPNPPSDSGDREQWQKHITAMDKYIFRYE